MTLGIPCHVRQWHKGDHGWFVVRDDNYERIPFEFIKDNTSYVGVDYVAQLSSYAEHIIKGLKK